MSEQSASPAQQRRGVALVVIMALSAAAGVALRVRGEGDIPTACEMPALDDGVLRCDGAGSAPGARAWLVGDKLDVNRATTSELELIDGVGPSLARAIVAERDARGGFRTFAELDDVPGIGPKTLEKLRASLEVR